MTGDFHCQEVETGSGMGARPLSRLTQHPANNEAKSLSTGTIRVGTRVAGPMGGPRIFVTAGVSPPRAAGRAEGKQAGSEESAVVLLSHFHATKDRNISALWKVNTLNTWRVNDEIAALFT